MVKVETVLPALEKFDVCAIITADEDAGLTMLVLQSEMPQGWNGGDPLARYKGAGIELVENLEPSMNSVGKD